MSETVNIPNEALCAFCNVDGYHTGDEHAGWLEMIAAANSLPNVETAEVWHSGGGFFGVLVTRKDGFQIFFGDADGLDDDGRGWGYDLTDADDNHIASGDYEPTKWSLAEWAADAIG